MTQTAAARVLWLDNDPAYVYPFVVAMREQNINVDVVRTVSEAEARLAERYDGIIVDIMIPVTEEEEGSKGYAGDVTDDSHSTGLEFYRRFGADLAMRGVVVIVMTVRVDRQIRDRFLRLGLPKQNFVMKMELRDSHVFVERVRQLLSAQRRRDG